MDDSINVCTFPSSSFSLFLDTNLSHKSSSSFSGAFDVIASVASDFLMFTLENERKNKLKEVLEGKLKARVAQLLFPLLEELIVTGVPPSAIQHQVLHDIKYYNMLKSRRNDS